MKSSEGNVTIYTLITDFFHRPSTRIKFLLFTRARYILRTIAPHPAWNLRSQWIPYALEFHVFLI